MLSQQQRVWKTATSLTWPTLKSVLSSTPSKILSSSTSPSSLSSKICFQQTRSYLWIRFPFHYANSRDRHSDVDQNSVTSDVGSDVETSKKNKGKKGAKASKGKNKEVVKKGKLASPEELKAATEYLHAEYEDDVAITNDSRIEFDPEDDEQLHEFLDSMYGDLTRQDLNQRLDFNMIDSLMKSHAMDEARFIRTEYLKPNVRRAIIKNKVKGKLMTNPVRSIAAYAKFKIALRYTRRHRVSVPDTDGQGIPLEMEYDPYGFRGVGYSEAPIEQEEEEEEDDYENVRRGRR